MNELLDFIIIACILLGCCFIILVRYIYEEYMIEKGGEKVSLTKEDILVIKNYLDKVVSTESSSDIAKVYEKINLLVELGDLTDKFILERGSLEERFNKLEQKENKE